MVRTPPKKPDLTVRQLLDQITAAQQISRQHYLQLSSAILADISLSQEDRRRINRLFDDVQTRRLHLID